MKLPLFLRRSSHYWWRRAERLERRLVRAVEIAKATQELEDHMIRELAEQRRRLQQIERAHLQMKALNDDLQKMRASAALETLHVRRRQGRT